MTTWQEEQKMVDEAIAKFPKKFGLVSWPKKVFTICKGDSFVSESIVYLYVHIIKEDGSTAAFAKCTIEELKRNFTHAYRDCF